jgi:hypothetical protein
VLDIVDWEAPKMGHFAKLILMCGWFALAGAVTAAPSIFCGQTVWEFGTI